MTGVRKPKSREAFDLNMNDAETLVSIAKLLENERINRMRAELRTRIGTALRIPRAKHSALECLENQQVFIAFKPGSAHLRGSLTHENLRPLLRQALVAGCAAVETYVADRTMELLGPVLRAKEKPPRLLELTMTVQQYLKVQSYQRQNWGLRDLIEDQVLLRASTSPSSIGMLGSPYLTGVPPIRPLRPARPDPAGRPYGALATAPLLVTFRDRLRRGSFLACRAARVVGCSSSGPADAVPARTLYPPPFACLPADALPGF